MQKNYRKGLRRKDQQELSIALDRYMTSNQLQLVVSKIIVHLKDKYFNLCYSVQSQYFYMLFKLLVEFQMLLYSINMCLQLESILGFHCINKTKDLYQDCKFNLLLDKLHINSQFVLMGPDKLLRYMVNIFWLIKVCQMYLSLVQSSLNYKHSFLILSRKNQIMYHTACMQFDRNLHLGLLDMAHTLE